MEENRAMVMGGGMMRMNYADGNPEKLYDSVFDAREAADNEDDCEEKKGSSDT